MSSANLDDLDFSENSAFDKEAQVLRAPELDDLDDTDNLAVCELAGPSAVEPSLESSHAVSTRTAMSCPDADVSRIRPAGEGSIANS